WRPRTRTAWLRPRNALQCGFRRDRARAICEVGASRSVTREVGASRSFGRRVVASRSGALLSRSRSGSARDHAVIACRFLAAGSLWSARLQEGDLRGGDPSRTSAPFLPRDWDAASKILTRAKPCRPSLKGVLP